MIKDVAEAKCLPYELILRTVSLAALNRIFCQQLDIKLEAHGEQTKNLSSQLAHFEETTIFFSVLQQRHQKTTTTTKTPKVKKQTNKNTSD